MYELASVQASLRSSISRSPNFSVPAWSVFAGWHERVEGVAMGSPLGSLMLNAFVCYVEETLTNRIYRRYVDDPLQTLGKRPDVSSPSEFFLTRNKIHPSLSLKVMENFPF